MRRLLPSPSDAVDLHDHYGADWLDAGGVRVNFVSSVDGGAHVDGASRGLQTTGDNAVFKALRDLADVVLAGAGTAVGEKYRAVHPSGDRLAARRAHGLADTLPVAVTSRLLRLDPSTPLFTDAHPDARTIVLTCAAADASVRATLADVADVVVCGDEDVDPVLARTALEERGYTRILFEGGPTVFSQWATAGAVDELCLSVSPMLVGPDNGRITGGDAWDSPASLSLVGLLEEDGALFLRYGVG